MWIALVLATTLGATGAWVATAVAKPAPPPPAGAPAGGAAECAAFPVPFVHNPDNIKPGGRQGQQLPEGWTASGGGVMDGRPIVIACR